MFWYIKTYKNEKMLTANKIKGVALLLTRLLNNPFLSAKIFYSTISF